MRDPKTFLVTVCLLLLGAVAQCADEPELPKFHVVRPSGEAHELLPKTCGVCHKDQEFQFFVVAAPSEEGIKRAYDLLSVSADGEAPPKPPNPHLTIACLFCHMEQPARGGDPLGMQFRTMQGTGVGVSEVEGLCRMCHAESPDGHPKVLAGSARPEDLLAAGLPVHENRIVCSTCHEMHFDDAGPADVRLALVEFSGRSVQVFPHGNRVACRACHPTEIPRDGAPTFLDQDPRGRCERCHVEDHDSLHPVVVAPSAKSYPMEFLDFPLGEDGKTTCSTCHDHVCWDELSRDNPRFLRDGPYQPFTEFCYLCHPKAGEGGMNPHDQVDEAGQIISMTCVFCHRQAPEDPEGDDFDQRDLLYLRSPVELCMRCHDPGPHPVGVNHLQELRPDMVSRRQEYLDKHKVKIPLDGEGRVVCTTCHNPHAKGVLRGASALGAGEENLWRVPTFAELCSPCHGRML